MNIILKSFDGPYCKEFIEHALKNFDVGTCISIIEDQIHQPNLGASKNEWLYAPDVREGKYEVNWAEITPIDEELIENMRECEAVFMNMISRYTFSEEIPYAERKRRYFAHLQYWNHILETEDINLMLFNHIPHMAWDYVIYKLCKLKNIPTLCVDRCSLINAFFITENWEEPGKELKIKMEELKERYQNPDTPIPLTQQYEWAWQQQTERNERPVGTACTNKHLQRKFLAKWYKKALKVLHRNPKQFISCICSLSFWRRKWEQHTTPHFYNKITEQPDYSELYIYVPLHREPESSTCPKSGGYADQERLIELLAWHLPSGVRLYVKEHPSQDEQCRTKEFYRRLQNIPAVKLIERTTDTFKIAKNAVAIATGTGSAGYEALFREKPVFMFGHRFYQYAPGVLRIRTAQDCKNAIKKVFEQQFKPIKREMRMFLKAMEECAAETYLGPMSKQLPYSMEKKIEIMGDYIAQKIKESGVH